MIKCFHTIFPAKVYKCMYTIKIICRAYDLIVHPLSKFVTQIFVTENGSQGNLLAVSSFRRRACLRSRAHDFHSSIDKRCGRLGCNFSFTEIHVLYMLKYQVPWLFQKFYFTKSFGSTKIQCLEWENYSIFKKLPSSHVNLTAHTAFFWNIFGI